MSSQRLSKRLMQTIGCSRSEAERYILAGFVTVDGQPIDLPQHPVEEQQIVALAANAKLIEIAPVTLLANQNQTDLFLSKDNHWLEDAYAHKVLNAHFQRLQISLALPDNCSGLQVFSQDWRSQRKLKDDANKLEQEFILSTTQTQFDLAKVKQLVQLSKAKFSWQNEQHIRLAMKQPPQNLVQLLAQIGLQVEQAKRIRIGGISLGKVPAHQWRYMKVNERF